METPKNFGALLSVVVKHLFENASVANLKQDYFPEVEVSPEGVFHYEIILIILKYLHCLCLALSDLFDVCKGVLSEAAVENLDIAPFETLVQKEVW